MKKRLEENGVTFQYYHCCNSAGIIDVKEANLDLVRAGISTYGVVSIRRSGEGERAA